MLDVISLQTPQRKWASSRLEGRTSCIFSSCGRCSRLTTGTSGTRSGGLRKGQSACELLGALSGFLSRRCRGLRLPGASVRQPARDKVMRKEADIRKACSDFRDPSGNFSHVPQQKSAGFCALLFHSSDIFWKKSSQGVSLLHLKECFNPKTL